MKYFKYWVKDHKYQIFKRVCLFSKDLNWSVLIDGDGAGGDEELFDGALILKDGHDARSQHGQGGDVVGQDAKRTGERWHINLFDSSILDLERAFFVLLWKPLCVITD